MQKKCSIYLIEFSRRLHYVRDVHFKIKITLCNLNKVCYKKNGDYFIRIRERERKVLSACYLHKHCGVYLAIICNIAKGKSMIDG